MPTLIFGFPGRRYHATPWGHHVNEGLVEWPPSPWRLLRALLSTGYSALGWADGAPPADARSLVEKLSAALPRYRVPSAVGAHSRHYMPLGILDKGREKTTLVFDTWAEVGDGELAVAWDVELTAPEAALLAQLLEALGYLGRSESWVVARLAKPGEPDPVGADVVPCTNGELRGPGWEQVALMAPIAAGDYLHWREAEAEATLARLEGQLGTRRKVSKKQKDKALAAYPADLLACLQARTGWLREQGWSQPPGARRVFYWRPTICLEAGAPQCAPTSRATAPVAAMLLAITSRTSNEHVLPPVTRTLPQAELLHRALVGLAAKALGEVPTELRGCEQPGSPLRNGHRHLHVLPLDLDADGHLEHVLLWSPAGLGPSTQAAVRMLRRTHTRGQLGPLSVALAATGSFADLRALANPWGAALAAVVGPPGGARRWVSRTPFVPPRHPKPRGPHTLDGQIRAELASRGLPQAVDIRILDPSEASRLRDRHYVRTRRRGPAPPIDLGLALAITLAEPIQGPLCLGYGSHFGLGLLAATEP